MINDFPNTCYKTGVKCIIFEFTVYGRTCNTELVNYPGNGNTAVFDGFLQYLALVRHRTD